MRAFICEVDETGLRRLLSEDVLAGDGVRRYTRHRFARPTTVAWTLLDDGDAESIRSEVAAGHHDAACGLLLNLAVELVSLGSPSPGRSRELLVSRPWAFPIRDLIRANDGPPPARGDATLGWTESMESRGLPSRLPFVTFVRLRIGHHLDVASTPSDSLSRGSDRSSRYMIWLYS